MHRISKYQALILQYSFHCFSFQKTKEFSKKKNFFTLFKVIMALFIYCKHAYYV